MRRNKTSQAMPLLTSARGAAAQNGEGKSASDRVAAQLEHLIVKGSLPAGQALPPERQLCEELGISRAALREGLHVLRGRGLVDTAHGRGTYVAKLVNDSAAAPLWRSFSAQAQTLYDLLELRSLLEGESARLAAIRGTDADFALLAQRYEELRSAQVQGASLDAAAHARLDHAFHLSIAAASHNAALVHTVRLLGDLLLSSVFTAISNLYHREPHKQELDSQHSVLYQAVLSRQPEAAQCAAQAHLRGISHNLHGIL